MSGQGLFACIKLALRLILPSVHTVDEIDKETGVAPHRTEKCPRLSVVFKQAEKRELVSGELLCVGALSLEVVEQLTNGVTERLRGSTAWI